MAWLQKAQNVMTENGNFCDFNAITIKIGNTVRPMIREVINRIE